jgi:hypothetical protein
MEEKYGAEAGNGSSIFDTVTPRQSCGTVPFEFCIKAEIILIEKLTVQTDRLGTTDISEGSKKPNVTKEHS